MKSLTELPWFEVPGRRGFVNMTGSVERRVAELEKLAPPAPTKNYRRNLTGEDNADAYLRQVMGREVVVAIPKGQLDFGPWEQVFYGQFGGSRRKRVLAKTIGE